MLSAVDISRSFPAPDGKLDILSGVTFHVEPGESLAIMGASGCGKSTLLNILGALEPPTSGEVKLGEVNPFELPANQLAAFRNRHIGFVFQDHHLLPQCNVYENVLLPSLAFDRGDKSRRAEALISEVGLQERKHHHPGELSGGERQRAALARALINSPEVVLADEPTGNLDGKTAHRVLDLLLEIHAETQCALIAVTHSTEIAKRFQKRARLTDGNLQFE
jgi:lipoprotein-releasing system ATP-binding protein